MFLNVVKRHIQNKRSEDDDRGGPGFVVKVFHMPLHSHSLVRLVQQLIAQKRSTRLDCQGALVQGLD